MSKSTSVKSIAARFAFEELDDGGADVVDVALHAAARVERQPEVQRQHVAEVVAVLRIPFGEIADRLRLAFFDDLEVFRLEAGDGRALLVGEDHRELDEIDAGLEALLAGEAERRHGGHGAAPRTPARPRAATRTSNDVEESAEAEVPRAVSTQAWGGFLSAIMAIFSDLAIVIISGSREAVRQTTSAPRRSGRIIMVPA